jgi:hypothetical protein
MTSEYSQIKRPMKLDGGLRVTLTRVEVGSYGYFQDKR